jgi:hypothetical protein
MGCQSADWYQVLSVHHIRPAQLPHKHLPGPVVK